jgi:carboxyl-terminal processing protease
LLEADDTPDPRFILTAAQLQKQGVKDFQLDYALKTLKRLVGPVTTASADLPKKSR